MSASGGSRELLEECFGPYAEAAAHAGEAAAAAAEQSWRAGRIPIAGAAVERGDDGVLRLVALGVNGRIPPRGEAGNEGDPGGEGYSSDEGYPSDDGYPSDEGYPSDHGETGAIRGIPDFAAIDWGRTVFATTLSPCILCTRTLIELHGRGLRRVVIAEATSFPGRRDLLAQLPGMQIALLEDERVRRRMEAFARSYPWDWQADIGGIAPSDPQALEAWLGGVAAEGARWTRAVRERVGPHGVGVLARNLLGETRLVAWAADERPASGGNPCRAAVPLAVGRAGSALNLREAALVWGAPAPGPAVDLAAFGASGLGLCELFRPAIVLSEVPAAPAIAEPLAAAGVAWRLVR